MSANNGMIGVGVVFEVLGVIWNPTLEAMKVRKELNVQSLAETIPAVKRAGIEVCYADLPETVSGFAKVIEGQPFIVINRAKSRYHTQYTVSHELGHHVLHLNPSRPPDQPVIPLDEGMQEFQANMFAAAWVLEAGDDSREKTKVFRQNPESAVLVVSALVSVGVILVAVLVKVASYLNSRRLSQSEIEE